MPGSVAKVFAKYEKHIGVEEASSIRLKAHQGIVGSIHTGPSNPRHVLMVSLDTLNYFGLAPGDLKENIVISGFDVDSLKSGDLVKIGDFVEIRVTFDCEPCSYVESLQQGLLKRIEGRRGVLGHVLKGGTVKLEDSFVSLPGKFGEIPYKIPDRFVWLVKQIPYGKVLSYEQMIESLGLPKVYYRVIPSYIKRYLNSELPLHRIVDSKGGLIDYVEGQGRLLGGEDIRVVNNQVSLANYAYDLGILYR